MEARRRLAVAGQRAQAVVERDGGVVVAKDGDRAPVAHELDARLRVRPVADDVAEADDAVHAPRLGVPEGRLERGEVAVDVREEGGAHEGGSEGRPS